MKRRAVAAGVGFAAVRPVRTATAQPAPPPGLVFGVITTTTPEDARLAWDPFFARMSQAVGADVRGYYPATYRDAVDAVVGNRVQLAWVSNKAALDCVERANVEVFAQLVDSEGSLGYRSIVITRSDSGINSIDRLLARAQTFGFAMGETGSTSGFMMPSYALFTPRGVKPEEFFRPFLRGTHAQTLAAVLAREVHAGTYNTEELSRLRQRQPAQADRLRVLWESSLIPKDPLLWRRDLPLSVRTRIAGFIFSYGRDAASKQRLHAMFDLAGFKPSSNAQLKFVLDIEDFRDRSSALLDSSLSEAQRTERLGDLRERYARLARTLLTTTASAASP